MTGIAHDELRHENPRLARVVDDSVVEVVDLDAPPAGNLDSLDPERFEREIQYPDPFLVARKYSGIHHLKVEMCSVVRDRNRAQDRKAVEGIDRGGPLGGREIVARGLGARLLRRGLLGRWLRCRLLRLFLSKTKRYGRGHRRHHHQERQPPKNACAPRAYGPEMCRHGNISPWLGERWACTIE
jgi:hypothetical protein